MRLKYNADTQIIFQIGDPIDKVCATYLHNALYDFANINAVCLSVRVKKGELGEFVRAAKTLNISGFDITMPHKTDIIPYLDECDPASEKFKCVNHVKITDGRLIGIGLDGVGMGLAISRESGMSLKNKHALIIGAGAVAGPIAADLCARGISEVTVVNRTPEKSEYIASVLRELYGIQASTGPLNEAFLSSIAANTDIAVQCTSMGYEGNQDFKSLDFVSLFPKHCIVADVLYPDSTILKVARSHGLKAIDGRGMLFQQQMAVMEFRFGIKLPDSAVLEAEESVAIAVAMREVRESRKIR